MKPPNILFVFSDQHRYSALGSSGSGVVQTPNLDRLAAEGTAFDQAFSCYPLCSPYRAQLLTGTYCHRNLVVCNEYALKGGQPTLAEVLGQAGYHTGFIGKWHLGHGPYPEPRRHGFDYLAAYNCGHGFYKTTYHENERGPIPFDCWAPEGETSLAIEFMTRHQAGGGNSPFALMVGWAPPHWPYDQFPQEFNTYDPAGIEPPGNVPEQMRDFARGELAQYYGCVSALDAQMGRLLEALERLGLAEDTIVCYSSDHGDHLSSHGYGKPGDTWLPPHMRASKATPYEESIHVPFLIRWPGEIPAGIRCGALVDVMPTLLGLCGLESPGSVQGADLSHAARCRPGPLPDSVYLQNMGVGWPNRREFTGFWRGLRTERWLYARWLNDRLAPWLFDSQEDPAEMRNLAGKPEHAQTQQQLEARLQRWIEQTEDPFETGQRDDVKGMLVLGQEFASQRWKHLKV
ncbi:MAG: hypothetical protein AMJ81_06485 [Phycisphaerae bacterium SM23_33]|nr:MAG: hypothetical protein AMJ81_06485 [Phycisphaerae bacterium SM23_33]